MALPRITSPHAKGSNRTQRLMTLVILATLPGLGVLTWLYGIGNLVNLLLASATALLVEALVLKIRQRPLVFFLNDRSALLSAVLLALALPPYAPWWLTVIASASALLLGKHLYGGLGQNPFNPAMLGYVVVLISFPLEMTRWPGIAQVSPGEGLQLIFGLAPLADGWVQATVLDTLKLNHSLTLQELYDSHAAFGLLGGAGSEWVNLAFLLGGLFLLYKKVISWHAPLGMLLALLVMSLLFWNGSGSASHGSPLLHLLSGATMLGAFFIITDPVSGATSPRGRLVFGMGVGIILYVIRAWGGYPDAMAFAVLLMNLAAPTIDYYTRPRTYGHRQAERGFKLGE
ncbi:RnfABCDGE type electron transport complex subunit D [Pseudomonas fluvialis]|jgi:electron transport complex protein RnfD|uniref:Ion-translocating oxidoreductase complex subunit D n=1 Tax=Pseudomonas fluvialis TaxID=1793966 RepID=A0A2I0CSB3_9PSED|nr:MULTISPECIES: RnfABCDGE type electron transport complex subunit D [Pseudomonas]MBP8262771.1 RnfABCDGE type electron transport complex subunit D [Pseudomonas sp.]OXM41323.1 electron transport complex subunit RsxD [Pseudomonas fluvialis]PKF72032.1 electron transport complex subunit RsxD [Pseudomonas pharmacofabricae]GGH92546.1 electron transport complex subunit D [Pseudomonas fluvialis]